jgi:hypothetical protein
MLGAAPEVAADEGRHGSDPDQLEGDLPHVLGRGAQGMGGGRRRFAAGAWRRDLDLAEVDHRDLEGVHRWQVGQ